MIGESLELKLQYPEFSLRRYGIVLTGPKGRANKPFIPPSAAFLGRILEETRTAKERAVERWLQEYNQAHDGYEAKIDLSRKYKIRVKEGRRSVDRFKHLRDLNPEELIDNILRRMKVRFGSRNLWYVGGRGAFGLLEENGGAHIGNIVITSDVKSKGPASRGRTPKFYRVMIAGWFRGARTPLGKLLDTCPDFEFTYGKQGYTGLELLDTHGHGLLNFAHQHPDELENIKAVRAALGGEIEFFLPFNAYEPQHTKHTTRAMRAGQQPDFMHLSIDVLLDVLFNQRSLARLDIDLADIPVIYDPALTKMLERGDAAYEAIVNKYIFEVGNPVAPAVRALFNQMRERLEFQGYRMAGYVLEKKGTPEEIVALEFRKEEGKQWESVRLVFSSRYPPVYIKRVSLLNRKADLFAESKAKIANPYEELFKPKSAARDDRTRQATYYEACLPMVPIEDPALRVDYRTAIERYFVGPRGARGIKGLQQQIAFRDKLVVQGGMPAKPLTATQKDNLYRILRG